MRRSITRRLLLSNLLILIGFLGFAGAALDNAFRNGIEIATREKLQAHVYTLLAAAGEDAVGRLRMPERLAAPGFNRPDSGLYAEIQGEDGGYRWRSASLLGQSRSLLLAARPGETRFRYTEGMALLDMGVAWDDAAGRPIEYALTVAVDRQPIDHQQQGFRGTLWAWLGGVMLLLLMVQIGLFRWGLRPLRDMSAAVQRLEQGQSSRIEGPVASELQGLSDNLNSLITLSAQRQERVRNSLADLAHSLKTPLAILRGAAEQGPANERADIIREQTRRIDDIVSYQRQRAAVAGGGGMTRPVAPKAIVRRLCASLDKLHHARGIDCAIAIDDHDRLRADPGDLFELFGNLLENAYKHARGQVRIGLAHGSGATEITIDDDGPGIATEDAGRLLRRGERADQRHPGEGIGLAVANEIMRQYGGALHLEQADLGGTRVRLVFPAWPA